MNKLQNYLWSPHKGTFIGIARYFKGIVEPTVSLKFKCRTFYEFIYEF